MIQNSVSVALLVNFVREPQEQPYGPVALFEDLCGNLWDLLSPIPE
jgi:hypothetical protein